MLSTLCYVKKNGKTLMMHRAKKVGDVHAGKWNGLGGKMHAGETPEECVIREVKEESGLDIQAPELKGILTFPAFREEEDWYTFVFVARDFSGKPVGSSEGSLKWIPDGELATLDLWEGDPIFLKLLAENRFFSGKFVYENGKLIRHHVVVHPLSVKNPDCPAARANSKQVQKRFREGVELFNEERFFECHEVFERLWRETSGELRDLYKGLVQAAVAFHHLKRGKIKGAVTLFQSSAGYLEKFKPAAFGLDLEKLSADLKKSLKKYEGKPLPPGTVSTEKISIPKLRYRNLK